MDHAILAAGKRLHSGDWVESSRECKEGVPKKRGCRLLMFTVLVDIEETEETL